MKLIMENWRKFAVNERKTDKNYLQIVNFLTSKFTPANLEVIVNMDMVAKDGFYWYELVDNWDELGEIESTANIAHNAYVLKFKDLKNLWKEYRKAFPQEEDIIFKSEKHFEKWVGQIKIYITYSHPEDPGCCAGDMGSDGKMRLYIGDKVDKLSINEIVKYIQNTFRTVFVHEGTHYLNAIRASGEWRRSAGGPRQFDSKTQEYVDSTEEIQAKLIEAFDEFYGQKIKKGEWGWKSSLFNNLKDNEVREFIKGFIQEYYSEFNPRWKLENHSKTNQKRLVKRIFEFAKEVKESDEFKQWLKIQPKTSPEKKRRFNRGSAKPDVLPDTVILDELLKDLRGKP